MVNWIEPIYSKSRVKLSGKNIRSSAETPEDVEVLENWRACHSYILNTFQATLRRRSRNLDVTVAQRLKRRNTIYDKLKREPNMQLSTMHDIAGCRLIFPDEEKLTSFRSSLHASRAKHILRSNDGDKYNYIEHPKRSGYRGIHDVYEYNVSSQEGVKWNGLLIEIQYRTIYQHAWATAVEVADLITSNRIKFSQSDLEYERFFCLASEIIARSMEGRRSCLFYLSDHEAVGEFITLNKKLGLINTLNNLKQSKTGFGSKKNTLLIFHLDARNDDEFLEVLTFDSVNEAIRKYEEIEKSSGHLVDIVLVRADSFENIRDAFRNYFSDAHDFVKYIRDGCERLAGIPLYTF